jgi:hypothetical protein
VYSHFWWKLDKFSGKNGDRVFIGNYMDSISGYNHVCIQWKHISVQKEKWKSLSLKLTPLGSNVLSKQSTSAKKVSLMPNFFLNMEIVSVPTGDGVDEH